MKKSYFMMAAAATIFAACSETDLVNPVYEAQNEIGFDNHVGKTTRAEITNEAALAREGGFVVWGYKTATAGLTWDGTKTITTIFNGVNVYGADGNWTYANKKYWDKTSTYNFYAVAPFSPASGAYSVTDAATGFVTITGVKSALASDSDDFMVDRNGAPNVNGDYTGSHPEVNFDFNHIMAKVSLQLQCGGINAGDQITVTSITMTGWNSNNGVFVQTLNATPTTTDNISEWSTTPAGTAGSAAFTGSYVLTPATDGGTAPIVPVNSYIMVPQTVAELTFTLNYTITYADATTENFLAHTGKLTAQTWGTDTHTTYTIIVGPAPIEFEVNTVNGFRDADDNPELPID